MTARKLKRMLRRTPWLWKLPAVMLIALLAATPLILMGSRAMVIPALFIGVLLIFILAVLSRKIASVRQRGRKTIEYLVSNELIEDAAREYSLEDNPKFRLTHRDSSLDKFVLRKNMLSPSFIFAMCDNAILRYSDVAKAVVIRYKFETGNADFSVDHVNDVLTLVTHDGDEIDLYAMSAAKKNPRKLAELREIARIIKEKNDSCFVCTEVFEIRKGRSF